MLKEQERYTVPIVEGSSAISNTGVTSEIEDLGDIRTFNCLRFRQLRINLALSVVHVLAMLDLVDKHTVNASPL